MEYRYTYDINTNEVIGIEMITTDTIIDTDDSIAERYMNGDIFLEVQNGALVEVQEPTINIEENIIPEGEIVGVSAAEMAEEADQEQSVE